MKVKVDENKRTKLGKRASFIGILINVILACGKMAVGIAFGLLSVLADGLNNLTDCGSSVISVISFKLSSKPADKEHPYGHERIEYVCSMVVAFIILVVAFELIKESIGKIINPTESEFSFVVIGVLTASVLFKCTLFIYYRMVAKKIDSQILKASAVDSLSDCVATTVVIISVIVSKITEYNIDGYAGILVSLFIAYSGFGILKEVFSMLIGKAPEQEMLKEIKERMLSYEGVLGVHDLSVYSYGPNKYFASAHVEVDAKVDVLISHELVDAIEKDFIENMGIILTGHLDPVVVDDERVNTLKEKIENIISSIDCKFSIHDFRMVFGENRTNVLFDVAIPYDAKLSKAEIRKIIEDEVYKIDEKYCLVITIEQCV